MASLGKYELVRKLATGGMAEVFLAKAAGPMGFAKTLVVKRILPHLVEDPRFVEMFLSEAKLAAQLTHPNVVQIFDFGQADDVYYLAMEYIDGPNLRILARRAHDQGSPLPLAICAKIISLACEGLAYAHEFVDPETGAAIGLIHRDVSPDNIILARNGAVKVVDFGIAKAANQSHVTKTGLVKGKLAYMAPEQLSGKGLDRRVDVFGLGVVLYELLSAQKPYDAESEITLMHAMLYEPMVPVLERRADIPPGLVAVVDRALSKDRELRYPSCREMQADLERFLISTGETVGTYQISQHVVAVEGEVAPGGAGTPPPRSRTSSVRKAAEVAAAPAPAPKPLENRTPPPAQRKEELRTAALPAIKAAVPQPVRTPAPRPGRSDATVMTPAPTGPPEDEDEIRPPNRHDATIVKAPLHRPDESDEVSSGGSSVLVDSGLTNDPELATHGSAPAPMLPDEPKTRLDDPPPETARPSSKQGRQRARNKPAPVAEREPEELTDPPALEKTQDDQEVTKTPPVKSKGPKSRRDTAVPAKPAVPSRLVMILSGAVLLVVIAVVVLVVFRTTPAPTVVTVPADPPPTDLMAGVPPPEGNPPQNPPPANPQPANNPPPPSNTPTVAANPPKDPVRPEPTPKNPPPTEPDRTAKPHGTTTASTKEPKEPKEPKESSGSEKVPANFGTLRVVSEPPAKVRVGKRTGSTPFEAKLAPGPVTFEVYDSALGISREEKATIVEGQVAYARVKLGKGHVDVNSAPFANVSVDGKSLGMTPLSNIELWEGRHTIKFEFPSIAKPLVREFRLEANERKTITPNSK